MKRNVLTIAAIVLAVVVAAGAYYETVLNTDASPDMDDGTPVLARVNGKPITQGDLRSAFARLPQNIKALPQERLLPALLTDLINKQLMAIEGRKQDLQDDPTVLRRVDKARDEAIQEVYQRNYVNTVVTDQAVRQRYDEFVANLDGSPEIRARHILVETQDEARAIIRELDGGADFATLAEERSTGPSASSGGDLGYFKKGQMVKEFSDAAFALAKGEYSHEPVQSQFGWHVIYIEDIRTPEAPSFESQAPRLRQELARQALANHLESLRAAADIERVDQQAPAAVSGSEGESGSEPKDSDD